MQGIFIEEESIKLFEKREYVGINLDTKEVIKQFKTNGIHGYKSNK